MAIFLLLVGLGVLFFIILKYLTRKHSLYILDYLQKNASNDTASLTVMRNGETLASLNSNTMLPLASTVKIIIAIEYAKQCEQDIIDPTMEVSLEELDNYYIPRTDGGAHEAWLKKLKTTQQIKDNKTTLEQVAKGMIQFSSNANTEYLLDLLTLEKVNNVLDFLDVKNHDAIYPFTSALFVSVKLKQMHSNDSKEQIYKKLSQMSMEEYIQLSKEIFKDLKQGKKEAWIAELELPKNVQKIWSDRLPRSTTAEYATIMQKLNRKDFLSEKAQLHIDTIMEGLMEEPGNQNWLKHAGQKGGSTLFVVTNALYATDKQGDSMEIIFFANDLKGAEMLKLLMNLNEFNKQLLQSEEFRSKLKELK